MTLGRAQLVAKHFVDALERRRVPAHLRARWTVPRRSQDLDETEERTFRDRLGRDRTVIVPWLDRFRAIRGSRILEVGCGAGASTMALCEQGGIVTASDVSPAAVGSAELRVRSAGLDLRTATVNAAALGEVFAPGAFDWIIFWASLEHMTLDERLDALAAAWRLLEPGGLVTVIETPNRLWYHDSHTSRLPFFLWLPDDLAYRVANQSERPGFGDRYGDPERRLLDEFRRRGRGVSYHEFDVAIGPAARTEVVSCLQLERRQRSTVRRVGWRWSCPGRYEALLRRLAPTVPRAYFQPFLYLTLRRPA